MAIMRGRTDYSRARRFLRVGTWGLAIALITAFSAGCAHSNPKKKEELAASIGGIPSSAVPPFLNGAMAVLLTNAAGFRARVVMEGAPSTSRTNILSGELMSRDGKLFFAPEPGSPADKHSRVEDLSYIW